jgi:hypothetical protein
MPVAEDHAEGGVAQQLLYPSLDFNCDFFRQWTVPQESGDLGWLVALAGAPLHICAVAAGADLHHAAVTISSEFKVLVTGGTARGSAICHQLNSRCRAVH